MRFGLALVALVCLSVAQKGHAQPMKKPTLRVSTHVDLSQFIVNAVLKQAQKECRVQARKINYIQSRQLNPGAAFIDFKVGGEPFVKCANNLIDTVRAVAGPQTKITLLRRDS